MSVTPYTLILDAEFEGPYGSTLSGSLHVEFTHEKPNGEYGVGGITVDRVRLQIGAAWLPFDGSLEDFGLLRECERHVEGQALRSYFERADMARAEAKVPA